MFVENTKEGELARRMREVVERAQHILKYRIKIVEKSGTPLRLMFPLTNLGGEDGCSQEDCITCNQEGGENDKKPPCRKRCVLYENICKLCNPGVENKTTKLSPPQNIPSIYVGESARSLQERGADHWRGFKEKREDSHILKHHVLHHGGQGTPSFHLRPVRFFRSALTRQVAEAVRIRRWGEGVVLNSKSEYNRCQLGRLTLGEEKSVSTSISTPNDRTLAPTTTPTSSAEGRIEEEEQEDITSQEVRNWESSRAKERRIQEIKDNIDLERGITKSPSRKRIQIQDNKDCGEGSKRRKRKFKYPILEEDWGEKEDDQNQETKSKDDPESLPLSLTTPKEQREAAQQQGAQEEGSEPARSPGGYS